MEITKDALKIPQRKTPLGPAFRMLLLAVSGICFSADAGPDTFRDSIPVLIPYSSPTIEQNPTLQWHPLSDSVVQYFIQIATDPTYAAPLIFVSVSDTQYTSAIDLPVDTIFWRVRADSSAWSETSSFIITDARIPVLIANEDPTFERQPTLYWHTPPVAITAYTIQISIDSLFDSTEIDIPVTDTMYTCQVDLPVGMIYWRVKADSSEFSDFNVFLVKDVRVPMLISFESEYTLDTKPGLAWHKITGAITYTIEIDNDGDFGSTIMSIPVSDSVFTPFEALPVGSIFWRVKSDLVNAWSDIDHFTILPDTIPFLIRFNGDTASETKPLFSWYSVSGADSYKFKLADNNQFTSAITAPLTDTSYTPDIELTPATWYWKVSCSKNLDIYSPVDSVVIDSLITFVKMVPVVNQNLFKISKLQGAVRIEANGLHSDNYCVQVYNLNGKCIKTLASITNNDNLLFWDYTDTRGNSVSAGMYLLVIKTDEKWYSNKLFFNKN